MRNKNNSNIPFEAPWFQDAYKAAVEFHEKDKVLDPRDRLDLYNIYYSISRAQLWGGWGGFALVFGTPFVYKFYKTNSIRGVKVPRNFVLGLVGMIVSSNICRSFVFNMKFNELRSVSNYQYDDPNVEKSSKQKKYEMMELLKKDIFPIKWASYFHMTHINPSRIYPDPKIKLEQMKNNTLESTPSRFINQRDPLGLYSGPKFDKQEGIPPPGVSVDNSINETDTLSTWDKIRLKNGITPQEDSWEMIRKENFSKSASSPLNTSNSMENESDFLIEK